MSTEPRFARHPFDDPNPMHLHDAHLKGGVMKEPTCGRCGLPMKLSKNGLCWLPRCSCSKFVVEDTPENRRKYHYQP